MERGKKFRGLDRVAQKHGDGLTIKEVEEIHGEVIIYFETGYRFEDQDEYVLLTDLPTSTLNSMRSSNQDAVSQVVGVVGVADQQTTTMSIST